MDIKVTFDTSAASAPAGFEAVVDDVAQFYDSQFSNPITVNIHVGWGEVDGQTVSADALGESISNYTTTSYTYAQIKAALDASALTAQAKGAVATLPALDPTHGGEFSMTTAEAKALGLSGASSAADGWAGFSSTPGTFDFKVTSNDPDNSDLSNNNEYDLFATVAHEFSEIMGRQMNFGINYGEGPGDGSGYYPLDLFDYSAPGVHSFNPSASDRYFSMDNGKNALAGFNTDPSGDLFDWGSGSVDAFAAFARAGVVNYVTNTDLNLMDLIGYELNTDIAFQGAAELEGPSLTFTVTNDSPVAAPASVTGLYLSATPTVTTAGVQIDTYSTPTIGPGESEKQTVNFVMPASVAAGAYYMGLVANADDAFSESNTSNNSSNTVQVLVLSDANVTLLAGPDKYLAYATHALTVAAATHVGQALVISSAISGAGLLSFSNLPLWFQPGAKMTLDKLSLVDTPVEVNANLVCSSNLNDGGAVISIASGDTLSLSGDNTLSGGDWSGGGTLALVGGATSITQPPAFDIAKIKLSGAETSVVLDLVDNGVTFSHDWDQTSGTVSVGIGDFASFTNAGDIFTGTLTGAGAVDINGAADALKNLTLDAATTKIDATSVMLGGTIDIAGLVSLTSADVVVGAGITHLAGGGTLQLSNLATNEIIGASTSAILENVSDKIEGAGNLGGGQMRLENEAGSVIDGNFNKALTIDTGANTIINAGLIEAVGAGGVTIASAVSNTGTLGALGGVLTVEAVVTGAGIVRISGGTADLASTFAENVTFTSVGGVLELAHSAAYTGIISGFSKTGASSLDLEDINFTSATESYSGTTSSGVLTVTDGTHTAAIKLAGNYATSAWVLSSDGHGGTTVVDPTPTTPSVHVVASAIAGFAPASGGSAAGWSPHPPLLHHQLTIVRAA